MEKEQVEKEIASRANEYASLGQSDRMYLLTQAVISTLRVGQFRMKQILGIDKTKGN